MWPASSSPARSGSFTPENFILNNSILVVAYVVFGGMGSLPGAMAGAAVLTWLPEFLKDQVPAEDRQMWIGAVILLMMIFRPAGLIPAKRRKAELSGLDKTVQSPRPLPYPPARGCEDDDHHRSRAAPSATAEVVYDVKNVTLRFGGVTSLNNVSLQMHRGEILAVIGPNGAGKTSLFNSLTGVYTPQEGDDHAGRPQGRHASTRCSGKKTHVINHMGVARTFQNIRLFPALTALENVKVGVETRQKSGPIAAMLGHALAASRGARVDRAGLRAAPLRRPDPPGQRARRLAGVRRAAAPRDRPGPRHRARA